jgi:site-specific recombinase XerD
LGKHQEYVFTFRGRPYDRVKPRTLQSLAKRAGVEKHVYNHLFRHTFASWHVMSGTSLYDLMKLGGWKKIESVMIYAHLSAEHMQAAASNREMIRHVFDEAKELG